MPDEPDLTAEALVTTETEWGLRRPGEPDADITGHPGDEARRCTESFMYGMGRGPRPVHYTLVRRTVTYGPWETVAGEH